MDGVININKPLGVTSFDVVRKIKKIAGTKKVGHTGTLDPEASGVLPVCIGKATKIVDYITNGSKEYRAVLRLGISTDTYDREGKILCENQVCCTETEISAVIRSFIGEISQIPPMYSAIKVDGKRLYELAREGIEIERKSRIINIYDIEIESINIPFVSMIVRCSKGTYIRSLCKDIGDKLKCGGTMWSLERTHSSIFSIDDSISLGDLTEENLLNYLIPIEEALSEFPKLFFDNTYKKQLLNGVPVYNKELINSLESNQLYRVFLNDAKFIGLGIIHNNSFAMQKLLFQE